jgi:hypothetical protein
MLLLRRRKAAFLVHLPDVRLDAWRMMSPDWSTRNAEPFACHCHDDLGARHGTALRRHRHRMGVAGDDTGLSLFKVIWSGLLALLHPDDGPA